MSRNRAARPHGQIRRSQLITSFGPGAMVDLPDHSVLIGGLETWQGRGEEIVEPRLTDKLKELFDPPPPNLKLFAPPPDSDAANAPQMGVTAWQFPEWFIAQDVREQAGSPVRSRLLIHRRRLTRGKFVDDRRKKRSVVPVRFVRACRNGHIGDIDWYAFVHGGKSNCSGQLWIDERGTSGDLAEVWVRCESCRAERNVAEATASFGALGLCDGSRPWLGVGTRERCNEPNRLLIRTASNAYFPQVMSVISLPDRDVGLRDAVDSVWDFLSVVDEVGMLAYERKKEKVKLALDGFSDDAVFAAIRARRGETETVDKSIKQAEIETLIASEEELGDDVPEGNFYARTLPGAEWEADCMRAVERVVLVHRLREVMAQVGFSRFEAIAPDIDGELEMGVRRAQIAREAEWLPAIENRGEGVFLQFRADVIAEWSSRPDVQQRGEKLLEGYEAWKSEHPGPGRSFVESGGLLPYVLLHSFSHLLITAVSLGCGYPASSIRERIYALPDSGYGILLYTGTSDAEGTLGGLVQVGRNIREHVRSALELGQLCSNDPVCAQHRPANPQVRRFLHGAACHGCLLVSETSCEQHNEFLDRALVVPTVEGLGVEFFAGE